MPCTNIAYSQFAVGVMLFQSIQSTEGIKYFRPHESCLPLYGNGLSTYPRLNISEEETRIWHISFKGTEHNYRNKIASEHDRQGRKTFPSKVTEHAEGGAETLLWAVRLGMGSI